MKKNLIIGMFMLVLFTILIGSTTISVVEAGSKLVIQDQSLVMMPDPLPDPTMKVYLIGNNRGALTELNIITIDLYKQIFNVDVDLNTLTNVSILKDACKPYLDKNLFYLQSVNKWVFVGKKPLPLYDGTGFYTVEEVTTNIVK